MPIESTASTFLAWVQGTEGEARTEQAWARRYEQAHLEIFEVYYNGWGDPLRRVAAAQMAGTTAARIAHAARRAQDLIDDAARRFIDGGLLTGPDLPAVLLVGVGTSNGWVADLRGQPTLFLALEMLPDPPFDQILVLHEAAHLAHQLARPQHWPETVGARTFDEGLATAVSRHLLPGHDLGAYLWFQDGMNEWITACETSWPDVRSRLTDSLDLAGEPHGAVLFSAKPGISGDLPMRSGYYAGLKACDWLIDHRGIDVPSLLAADAKTAVAHISAFLAETS
jgi:hypothetical protein